MLIDAEEQVTLKIPTEILAPKNGSVQEVILKPLSVYTFQLIMKAAKDDASLIPLLIVKESVVTPSLELKDIRGMKVGLVNFLIKEIKRISGIS
ncbi:MAG: hypothetical protein AAF551_03930 [Bacteroidota bacterium]